MLDSDLNPWLLEVNLAPSLSADSPLDYNIKSNLIVDLFNLVGVRRPLKKKQNMKAGK
jgi:tubulin polyglutamylase TTLL5